MDDYGPPFGFAVRRIGLCLRGECRIKETADRKSVTQNTAPTQPGIFIETMMADISVVNRTNTGLIGLAGVLVVGQNKILRRRVGPQ